MNVRNETVAYSPPKGQALPTLDMSVFTDGLSIETPGEYPNEKKSVARINKIQQVLGEAGEMKTEQIIHTAKTDINGFDLLTDR